MRNVVVGKNSSPQLNAFCVTSTRAEIGQVNEALREALEACNFINASADQAYLETDPATRVTKDEYVMRYQQFARDGLEHALQKYDALRSSIGEAEMKRLKKTEVQFALTVADSLLARDKLTHALKSGKKRLREKHVAGLNREDLVFCGD
ncbi:g8554 [Coccomyxa elongata]